ncbi:DNA cytosine methyltransferase [Aeromicrobium sp. YIM 150415]|uniref:DNA cytosine methyltransferase n=1 Tax=Aeromicrobium sp. YIM 150415 TaxID=2803912 RepID=UPI001966C3A9|nr:DNA cytosine methyltransferase [Aeromicrobium sp. YIM 150415]MBM9464643.1 DNA cytosine methyltransferase [Aeromicrobium sp. YIM 150415]
MKASSEFTVTDLFAGAGGATVGMVHLGGVTVKMTANHWKLAVETHNENHPDTDHACVDLHLEDPRFFPRTTMLWASPECTKWSQGNGKQLPAIEEGLFEDPLSDDAATRSRLLMFDVLRFTEHHRYEYVIVENVVDIAMQAKYRLAWHVWRQDLRKLGYRFRVVSLNSMHAHLGGDPAPQSRDRLYIVAWREDVRAPDLDKALRPRAYCTRCDEVIEAAQAFKPGRTVGRYRAQYVYVHGSCGTEVEPAWLPAATAIDWTIKGTRIGDRAKPLAEKTRRRIAAGIARYWRPTVVEAAGNTYDAANPKHPAHGRPDGYYRVRPTEEVLTTLHTTEAKALAVPVEGRDGKTARSVDEPMRTQTTRSETALITRHYGIEGGAPGRHTTTPDEPLRTMTANGGNMSLTTLPFMLDRRFEYRTRGIDEPMSTLTANDTGKALVQPFVAELRGGSSDARPVADPMSTVTAGGNHHGLVTPAGGTWNDDARPTDEALRSLTTRDAYGLVTPYYSGSTHAKPTSEPLGTVTTIDKHALVMRNNNGGAEMSTPVREPLRTFTTSGHQSLITPGDIEAAEALVDDCLFRMFEPHEIAAGMAFPARYRWRGTRRQRVRMAGNAVTPPSPRDLTMVVFEAWAGAA